MAIWYIWYQAGIKSQMKRTTAGLVITERAADRRTDYRVAARV